MYCTHCGNKIPDDYNFCNVCGNPVKSESQNRNPSTKAKQRIVIPLIIIGVIVIALLFVSVVTIISKTLKNDNSVASYKKEERPTKEKSLTKEEYDEKDILSPEPEKEESIISQFVGDKEKAKGVSNDIFEEYINSKSVNEDALYPDMFTGVTLTELLASKIYEELPVGEEIVFEGTDNKNIQYYDIPEGTTTIGRSAFSDCDILEEVTIPSSVVFIDDFAFSGCSSLKSINLPDSLIIIGNGAFDGCKSISELSIPQNVKIIGDNAFSGTGITNVTTPAGLLDLGLYSFSGCRNLERAVVSEGPTVIRGYTFNGCNNLTDVTLPDGITEIGNCTFPSSLETVNLPSSLEKIGDFAFDSCESLSLTLPESLTSIGTNALLGVKNIRVPRAFLEKQQIREDGFRKAYTSTAHPTTIEVID